VCGAVLHADLPRSDYKPLNVLFQTLRPDIAIVYRNTIHLLELTICHETNMNKSRDYILNKYVAIRDNCTAVYRSHSVHLYTIKVSSLGVVSDIAVFTRACTDIC